MGGRNTRSISFRAAVNTFRDAQDTPRAFLERCLERIEQEEPVVRAFKAINIDGARRSADQSTARYKAGRTLSPVDGCPIGVKDIFETEDMPTDNGSRAFSGTRTNRDAACVQALRRGGAVIVGKTVTTEFAIGFSGPTTNPHDRTRTPGGSSSGSAAAVSCGMLPVALGTQTNGSVLRPASYCGVIGYKGTLGLLPTGGVHPLSSTLDHVGVFAGTLDDMWATLTWISYDLGSPGFGGVAQAAEGAPAPEKPLRVIRLHLKGWEELDDETRDVFEEKIDALRAQGIEIIDREDKPEIAAFEDHLDREVNGAKEILAYEMRWPYRGYVEKYGELIGARIHEIVKRSYEVTSAEYARLLEMRRQTQEATRALISDLRADAFVLPASSDIAPRGLEFTGSRTYLAYWSWLGFPACSLPLMDVHDMPFGLQLAHVGGEDRRLAAIAADLMSRI